LGATASGARDGIIGAIITDLEVVTRIAIGPVIVRGQLPAGCQLPEVDCMPFG
jgi:hypothetical protein